jgi:site-specific DNA recombinase
MPKKLTPRPTPPGARLAGHVRVAIYLRRSTDEHNQPFSIGAQEHQLEAFIASQPGWSLAARYSDNASGASGPEGRDGLRGLLEDAKAGSFDVVLVVRVDRLARRITLLYELLESFETAGVVLRSATEPFDTSGPMGRMLLGLLGILAQFERELLVDRIRSGIDEKARKGLWLGWAPYGYDLVDKVLVRNDTEAPLVERVFDMFVNERLGTSAIRNRLNSEGRRTPSGRRWSSKAIGDMLGSYAYIGLVTHYDEIHPGQHLPLIERAVWDEAQQIAEQRGDTGARQRLESDYLFSGLLRCGLCGGALSGTSAHGRSGHYRYYTCVNRITRGRAECALERLDADEVDRSVIDALVETYSDTALFLGAARQWLADRDRRRLVLEAELAGARHELAEVRDALERWYSAVEHGNVAEEHIAERLEALIRRRGELQRSVDDLSGQLAASGADLPTDEDIAAYATRVADALSDTTVTTAKKALLATLVDHVTVQSGRVLHPHFKVPGTPMLLDQEDAGHETGPARPPPAKSTGTASLDTPVRTSARQVQVRPSRLGLSRADARCRRGRSRGKPRSTTRCPQPLRHRRRRGERGSLSTIERLSSSSWRTRSRRRFSLSNQG